MLPRRRAAAATNEARAHHLHDSPSGGALFAASSSHEDDRSHEAAAAARPASSQPAPVALPSTGSSSRILLVTVGTTQFDALIESLTSRAHEFLLWARDHRFDRIVLQIGTGRVLPDALQAAAVALTSLHPDHPSMTVEWFRLSPDLVTWLRSAALVISHAGAGSILESLRLRRPLLVVVNPRLMHNHQSEVADQLARGRFLYQATPETVLEQLDNADWTEPMDTEDQQVTRAKTPPSQKPAADSSTRYRLVAYPAVESEAFPRCLDQHADALRLTTHKRALEFAFAFALPAAASLALTWTMFG